NDNLGKLIDLDFNKTLGNNSLESVTIDNLGSIIGGGTPSKKIAEYWNGDIPWITPKDLSKSKRLFTSSGNLWITNEGLAKSSAKILPIGTVLYSSRAPIGYISIADNPITTNQGFKSIVPNKGYSTEFIFELLKKETDNLINSANGSTFKEISGTQLKNHIVKIPTKLVCQQFSERVQPMFRIIRKLEQENFVLLQIKELLLNKFF
ncbi:restriction endonuclease subunit S, partial [Ligilactobacillus agilis]